MKKKVVAMLILAMLVTGCGANGSDDTNVTLETSEEAQGTDAGQQTGTGANETEGETSDDAEDNSNTVDVAGQHRVRLISADVHGVAGIVDITVQSQLVERDIFIKYGVLAAP